jgi:hypothetical protein
VTAFSRLYNFNGPEPGTLKIDEYISQKMRKKYAGK